MRSSEVARMAGVTVRTLRHYHQVGLLPEPPRHVNGYRHYDLATIARLLRIRRLADLGVPLDRAEVLLGAPEEERDDDAVLAEVDARLAAIVERAQEQRARIAELRTAPRQDVARDALGSPSTGVLVALERDAVVLLLHLLEGQVEEEQLLADVAWSVGASTGTDGPEVSTAAFDALGDDAEPAVVESVARELTRSLGTLGVHLQQTPSGRLMADIRPDQWPDVADDARLTGGQAAALRRMAELLDTDA